MLKECIILEKEEEETTEVEISKDAEAQFKDGTYTAVATGNNGDVKVTAIVENGYITSITSENEETPMIYKPVQEQLIPSIIYNQSIEVDSISGSTMSSNAIKTAMKDIMEQAKK